MADNLTDEEIQAHNERELDRLSAFVQAARRHGFLRPKRPSPQKGKDADDET